MTTFANIPVNHAKRLVVRLFDVVSIAIVSAILVLGAAEPAFAYVDPSVMTYTIQALAGVAVALGAVAGVALRRTRKWLFKALKIDENANKEVEGDVVRCNGAEFDAEQAAAATTSASAGSADDKTALPLKSRLIWAALASFFVVFTIVFVAPVEIIAANRDSFIFSLNDCWPPIALFDVFLLIVLTLVLALLKGRVFRTTIIALFAIGIGCYLQACFLNSGLPIANGAFLNLEDHKTMAIISSAVWVVLIALIAIACKKKPRHAPRILCVLALALVVVQSAGVASLMLDEHAGDSASSSEDTFVNEVGLYDLSPNNNVVVFVLDMFDIKNLDEVLVQYPDALDEFTDFTYYHNATASITPTRLGVPYLLTGRPLGDYDTFDGYLPKRFEDSHLIRDIYDAGYSVGIYTSDLWQGRDGFKDICINLGPLDKSAIDPWGVIVAALKTAFYRDAPWILKPLVWYSSDELNMYMTNRDSYSDSCTPYIIDDALYYTKIRARHVALNDTGSAGAFRFIHLQGAHYPYTIDAQGKLNRNTDKIQQCRGVLRIVSEYFRQMKDAGVYDDATIIVTADHGYWSGNPGIINEPEAPILLVHQPVEEGVTGGASLAYSNVPTGHQDFAASLIAAVGGDYREYGHPIWETVDGPRPRYYYMCLYNERTYAKAQIEFVIDGDVNNFDDWTLTGRVYPYGDNHYVYMDLEKGQLQVPL